MLFLLERQLVPEEIRLDQIALRLKNEQNADCFYMFPVLRSLRILSWSFRSGETRRLLNNTHRLCLLLLEIAFWKFLLYSRTSAGDKNDRFNCQPACNLSCGSVSSSFYLLPLYYTPKLLPTCKMEKSLQNQSWLLINSQQSYNHHLHLSFVFL